MPAQWDTRDEGEGEGEGEGEQQKVNGYVNCVGGAAGQSWIWGTQIE